MEYARIPVFLTNIAHMDQNVSKRNVLLLVKRAVAAKTLNIVILITKSVLINVQKMQIVLEDTNVRMDTVSNLVQNMANVLLLTNIATGRNLVYNPIFLSEFFLLIWYARIVNNQNFWLFNN